MEKYIDQLKKELESGKKSEDYLLNMLGQYHEKINQHKYDILSQLKNNAQVKVTRGGWFWKIKYFELRDPKDTRKSRKIHNPESWIGVCPNPPNTESEAYND